MAVESAADLAAFFDADEFAVTATWHPSDFSDSQSALVILDSPDEDILGGMGQSTEYRIQYAAGQLAGLKRGEELVIGAYSYDVREVRAIDDGQVVEASLSRRADG
jgi:hypothetical protein